jgi:chorismate mutase
MFQNSELDFDRDHPPELPDEMTRGDMTIWRERIDALDEAIIELFNKRAFCAHMIGKIKRELDMPVYVPSREEEVIDNVVAANAGPLPDDAIRRLYERIIDETRSLERRLNQQR